MKSLNINQIHIQIQPHKRKVTYTLCGILFKFETMSLNLRLSFGFDMNFSHKMKFYIIQ